MARLFFWPVVQTLEVGDSCFVNAPVSEVKRKVALYAARQNKRFKVTRGQLDDGGPIAVVEREPVTDSELPGA